MAIPLLQEPVEQHVLAERPFGAPSVVPVDEDDHGVVPEAVAIPLANRRFFCSLFHGSGIGWLTPDLPGPLASKLKRRKISPTLPLRQSAAACSIANGSPSSRYNLDTVGRRRARHT